MENRNNRSESPIESGRRRLLHAARVLLLCVIAYTAWHFGGTSATALTNVSVGLSVVILLLAIATIGFNWRPAPPPPIVWILPSVFIAYSILQCIPVPNSWNNIFTTRAQEIQLEFGSVPASELEDAAVRMGVTPSKHHSIAFSSIVPQNTKAAMLPILLASTMCFVSALIFDTSSTRKQMLWWVLINSTALSVWGVVQRSAGSVEILPGLAYTGTGTPFSSFIYRNAGAAAILPGIAAAMTLFYISSAMPRPSNRVTTGKHNFENRFYKKSQRILSAKELILIVLAVMLFVGVVASLSRGAWIAGMASLTFAAIMMRKKWSIGSLTVGTASLLIVFFIATGQYGHQIEARAEQLSIRQFTENERWAHWKDSIDTAFDHFPFGSGLGTYGYASLLNQTEPSSVWFREAHNQYLEVLTESGLVGAVMIVSLILLFTRTAIRLCKARKHPEERALGIFCGMIVLCIALQSTVDFVIKIPANLFLYASLLGMLCTAENSLKYQYPLRSFSATSFAKIGALTFFILQYPILGYCVRYSHYESLGDSAINESPLSNLTDPVDADLINECISKLDAAIFLQPDRSKLYRYRSAYRFACYRLRLVKEGERSGETIAWGNTRPEVIHTIISSLPEESRNALVVSLASGTNLSVPLGLALTDLATSLRHNPTNAQAHLSALSLSVLAKDDAIPWLDRASALSKSDPDKLYMCGFFAANANDIPRMKENWAKCLKVTPKYQRQILERALTKTSPWDIATEMVPRSQPDMMIALVRASVGVDKAFIAPSDSIGKKTAIQIAEFMTDWPKTEHGKHLAVAATILEIAGEQALANKQWLKAVKSDPRNANYRFKAAYGLRATGELNEALRHVTLGSNLTLENVHFDLLKERIRAELATASN